MFKGAWNTVLARTRQAEIAKCKRNQRVKGKITCAMLSPTATKEDPMVCRQVYCAAK